MSTANDTLDTPTLRQLFGFLEKQEGFQGQNAIAGQIYRDSRGIPTIGYGMKLTDDNALKAVLDAFTVTNIPVSIGGTPQTYSGNVFQVAATVAAAMGHPIPTTDSIVTYFHWLVRQYGKSAVPDIAALQTQLENALQDYLTGNPPTANQLPSAPTTPIPNFSFTLTTAQGETALSNFINGGTLSEATGSMSFQGEDLSIQGKSAQIAAAFQNYGATLPPPTSDQWIALVAAGFNGFPTGASKGLANNDPSQTWYVLRYNSTTGGGGPGGAKRNYLTSQMFGLNGASTFSPTLELSLQDYQMLTEHRSTIISFEQRYGANPDGTATYAPAMQILDADNDAADMGQNYTFHGPNAIYPSTLVGTNPVQTLAQALDPEANVLINSLNSTLSGLLNIQLDTSGGSDPDTSTLPFVVRSTDIFVAPSQADITNGFATAGQRDVIPGIDDGQANGSLDGNRNHIVIGSGIGDTLNGGYGHDVIVGGVGNETLRAGLGTDTLIAGDFGLGTDELVSNGFGNVLDFEFNNAAQDPEMGGALDVTETVIENGTAGLDSLYVHGAQIGSELTRSPGNSDLWTSTDGTQYRFVPNPTGTPTDYTGPLGGDIGELQITGGSLDSNEIDIWGFDLQAAENSVAGFDGIHLQAAAVIRPVLGGALPGLALGAAGAIQTYVVSVDVPSGDVRNVTIDLGGITTGSFAGVINGTVTQLSGDSITLTLPVGQTSVSFGLLSLTGASQSGTLTLTATVTDLANPNGPAIVSDPLTESYLVQAEPPPPVLTALTGKYYANTDTTVYQDSQSAYNDLVVASGAHNEILGALNGNNSLTGGNGADTIEAGQGTTTIVGGGGQDLIFGYGIDHPGTYQIYAESQTDLATAIANGNAPTGSSGRGDLIAVGNGNNTIVGGSGDNLIMVANGDNVIVMGTGNSVFLGGDSLTSHLYSTVTDWSWSFDPATGINIINAPFDVQPGYEWNRVQPYNGNLAQGSNAPVGSGDDTIFAGSGNHYLYLTNGNNYVDAGGGNDTIFAGMGNNTIVGGTGNDYVRGGGGNTYIDIVAGNNTLIGGVGNNTIFGGFGDDFITSGPHGYISTQPDGSVVPIDNFSGQDLAVNYVDGGAGSDYIFGSAGSDTLLGGSGDDTIRAGSGNEYVDGGEGNNYLVGGSGNNTIFAGGTGNDTLFAGDGNSTLYGGDGTDVLVGGAGSDVIYAGDGGTSDAPTSVSGGSGFTTIYGGGGIDDLQGGSGTTVMYAGDGGTVDAPTTLIAGSGATTIYGGLGTDFIQGGEGADALCAGDGGTYDSPTYVLGASAGTTIYGGASFAVLESTTDGELLVSGSGDDTLFGTGNDTLVAGPGNDIFVANDGNETYLLSSNSGYDLIEQNGGTAMLEFDTGVEPGDLTLTAALTDVGTTALDFSGGGISLDVLGGLTGVVDSVTFLDPQTMSLTDLIKLDGVDQTVNDANGTVIFSVEDNAIVTHDVFGAYTISAWGDNDTLVGGNGGDVIYAAGDNDMLVGGFGTGKLIAVGSNATIVGGSYHDETLSGGDNATYSLDTSLHNVSHTELTQLSGNGRILFSSDNAPWQLSTSVTFDSQGVPSLVIDNGYATITVDDGLSGAIGNFVFGTANLSLPQLLLLSNAVGSSSTHSTTDGGSISYTFDPNAQITLYTASSYDSNNRLLGQRTIDRDGSTTENTYVYNGDGSYSLTVVSTAAGASVSSTVVYDYDTTGALSSEDIQNTDGSTVSYTYNTANQLTGLVAHNVDGSTTEDTYVYNGDGSYSLTVVSTAAGASVSSTVVYDYDTTGALSSEDIQNTDGSTVSYTYNTANQLTGLVAHNVDGSTTEDTYVYNGDGSYSLTVVSTAAGASVSSTVVYDYDTTGALSSEDIQNTDGSTVSYTYNTANQLTGLVAHNVDGSTTEDTYVYNGDGSYSLTVVSTAAGASVSSTVVYDYDTTGALSSEDIQNTDGSTVSYTYNTANQLTGLVAHNVDGSTTEDTYVYNGDGSYSLTVVSTAAGASVSSTVVYDYDTTGALSSEDIQNTDGSTVSYTYNTANQLTGLVAHNVDGSTTEDTYVYNGDGSYSLTVVSTAAGASVSSTVVYDYDTTGALSSEDIQNTDGSTVSYTYNTANQLTGLVAHNVDGSTTEDTYVYNGDGSYSLTVVSTPAGGATSSVTYAYSSAGQLTEELLVNADGSTTDYRFDSSNRITDIASESAVGSAVNYGYTYSGDGADVLSVSSMVPGSTQATTVIYDYDNAGHLASDTIVSTDGSSTSYVFAPDGHMAELVSIGADGSSTAYEFDSSGRTIAQDVLSVDGSSIENLYVFNADSSYSLESISTPSDGGSDSIIRYNYDAQGSLIDQSVEIETTSTTTDPNGATQTEYRDSIGNLIHTTQYDPQFGTTVNVSNGDGAIAMSSAFLPDGGLNLSMTVGNQAIQTNGYFQVDGGYSIETLGAPLWGNAAANTWAFDAWTTAYTDPLIINSSEIDYLDGNYNVIKDNWYAEDGSYGSDWYSGNATKSLIHHANGTVEQDDSDGQGNDTAIIKDAAGLILSEVYAYADGSYRKVQYNDDRSYLVQVRDTQYATLDVDYAANGTKLDDTWQLDSTQLGTDTYASDGSGSGTMTRYEWVQGPNGTYEYEPITGTVTINSDSSATATFQPTDNIVETLHFEHFDDVEKLPDLQTSKSESGDGSFFETTDRLDQNGSVIATSTNWYTPWLDGSSDLYSQGFDGTYTDVQSSANGDVETIHKASDQATILSDVWQYHDGSHATITHYGDGSETTDFISANGTYHDTTTSYADGSTSDHWSGPNGTWGFYVQNAETGEERSFTYNSTSDWYGYDRANFGDGHFVQELVRNEDWSGGFTEGFNVDGLIPFYTDSGFGLDAFKDLNIAFSNTWIPDATSPVVNSISYNPSALTPSDNASFAFSATDANQLSQLIVSGEREVVYASLAPEGQIPDDRGYVTVDPSTSQSIYHALSGQTGLWSGDLYNPIYTPSGDNGYSTPSFTSGVVGRTLDVVDNNDGTESLYWEKNGNLTIIGTFSNPLTTGNGPLV